MISDVLLLLLTVLVASLLLTGVIRAVALRGELLDVPNQRSSHTVPTPRGGGLAFVAAFLAGIVYLLLCGFFGPDRFPLFLVVTSLLVAGIGFWDDLRPLPARYRFTVQVVAACLMVWAESRGGGAGSGFRFPFIPFPLLAAVLVLAVVWSLNLFNFMDGIDGLAASEGVFVAGGAAWLLALRGNAAAGLPLMMLAAACLGFLIWNWPPAGIFMGDVGSGFLGFVLAALALETSIFSTLLPVSCWLILPAVFLTDTTITLLRRMGRGEKWYAAHRSHAYQHAAIIYRSHLRVTLAVLALDLFWLLPLSSLCVILPRFGGLITVVAYLPLTILALKFKAGLDSQP